MKVRYDYKEYKGFLAEVSYDTEDKIFVGEIVGICDSLNFHGINLQEAEDMFHQSVDNYLTLYSENGQTLMKDSDRSADSTNSSMT